MAPVTSERRPAKIISWLGSTSGPSKSAASLPKPIAESTPPKTLVHSGSSRSFAKTVRVDSQTTRSKADDPGLIHCLSSRDREIRILAARNCSVSRRAAALTSIKSARRRCRSSWAAVSRIAIRVMRAPHQAPRSPAAAVINPWVRSPTSTLGKAIHGEGGNSEVR